jgi:hypothetical protein
VTTISDALGRMPERELRGLMHEHEGIVHQYRMEGLRRLLETSGPVRVVRTSSGLSGDRHILVLDDGSVMRLKLRHPDRERFALLRSVRWHEPFGWIVRGDARNGRLIECCGWWASLTLPSFPRPIHV